MSVHHDVEVAAQPRRRSVGRMARFIGVGLLVLFGLSAASCSKTRSSAKSTTTVPVATTPPSTTTTLTSIGGYIGTPTCPYYEVMSDGYGGIQESGVDIFYTVNATANQIASMCETQLKQTGWTILGGGQAPSTQGISLQATSGSAFAHIEISTTATPNVAVCTWPTKPTDTSCPFGG